MSDLGCQMADFAKPLPAMNSNFTTLVAQRTFGGRSLSANIKPRDLDFLHPASRLFRYPYGLYSAAFGIGQSFKETAISRRDWQTTTIFGDSGGYSFIRGSVPISNIASMRVDVLDWQQKHCNIGAILDVPTECIKHTQSGIKTWDQCLSLTQDSIDFAERHRDRSWPLRLLNVIQCPTKPSNCSTRGENGPTG